ncbi:MAG: hypothetical protein M1839_006952 [Geoglossum umbratile]|nr:MAG: hypothetical protein M1839_006952 [Geoglossum umbratile]
MACPRWRRTPEKPPMPQQQARVLFNKTLSSYGRQGDGEYKEVNSLFITWEDDDLGCVKKEVPRLQRLLADRFKFSTSSYRIPSQRSEASLQLEAAKFVLEHGSPDNLAIIYYGGHGRINDETQELELAAKGEGDGNGDPAASFSVLLRALQVIDCDVLIILDCCHAGKAFYPEEPLGMRKFELLTAASSDDRTLAPGKPGSFTTVMTDKIEELLDQQKHSFGFAISTLYFSLYHNNDLASKPLLFDMSQKDYGKLWLRPRLGDNQTEPTRTTLKLTLHIAKQTDDLVIHEIARGLQYLKNVQKITLDELSGPDRVVYEFVQSVRRATIIRNWRKAFLRRKRLAAQAENGQASSEGREAAQIDQEAAEVTNKTLERRQSSYYDWTTSTRIVNRERKPPETQGQPPEARGDGATLSRPFPLSDFVLALSYLAFLSIWTAFILGYRTIRLPSSRQSALAEPSSIIAETNKTPPSSTAINGHSGIIHPTKPNNITNGME